MIFWHGRTVHSAGVHVTDRIHRAVFGDYSCDREVMTDDEHRALGQYAWFKDTKLFKQDDLNF